MDHQHQQQQQPQGSIDASPSGDFPQRPIILSPPPLDTNSYSAVDALPTGHTNRQQSVGYNLQHEFETLTANLDLDLTSSLRTITQSAPPHQQSVDPQQQLQDPKQLLSSSSSAQSSKPALVAPAASRYENNLRSELLGKSTNSLLADSSAGGLSPAQQFSSLHPQLDSLLNKSTSNLVGSPSTGSAFLSGHLGSVPDRPQSVNDFSSIFKRHEQQQQQQQFFTAPQPTNQSNFYLDLIVFCNWIENLSPQDSITMIDYLCANLPLDILLTFQSKLDLHLQGGAGSAGPQYQPQPQQQQQQQTHLLPQFAMSPYNQYGQDLYSDLDQLSIRDDRSKPKQPSALRNSQYANFADKPLRPKSADPFVNNTKYTSPPSQQHQTPIDRAKSPTSHLYEKTNFLQLAAANSNSATPTGNTGGINNYYNQYMTPPLGQSNSPNNANQGKDIMDLKLGALATINSRVALDSNRKHPHQSNWNQQGQAQGHQPPQQQQQHNVSRNHAMNYEDSINRSLNSSSVPANMHRTNYSNNGNNNNNQSKSHKKKVHSPTSATQMQHNSSSTASTNMPSGTSSMPAEVSSLELLNNIPAWLKLLRLHKYTDCLKDIQWRELIELDNDQLEAKGVAALGARRKLLKAFDAVKNNPPQ
ncbi:Protein VTS1 [Candida viswanathii]|uniref:RNA-binding protein VTS1 n=1 Tax=Candida viswanathii TaxID=5486 RepID=A0A367XRI3_9ASCO|nr:Protein VTS1 [Candida viswanathii]